MCVDSSKGLHLAYGFLLLVSAFAMVVIEPKMPLASSASRLHDKGANIWNSTRARRVPSIVAMMSDAAVYSICFVGVFVCLVWMRWL